MGGGEFGGNGSVYWRVETPAAVPGVDPIPFTQIGAQKGHTGLFRIRLRYSTPADAAAGKAGATLNGPFLILDVPAINRPNPNVNPPWEIRIDW